MNSDESLLSIMIVKFPFLFPTSIALYPDYLYKKLHVHMDSNRKPEHARLFRADFDGQGNIHVIENKVLTKYVAV